MSTVFYADPTVPDLDDTKPQGWLDGPTEMLSRSRSRPSLGPGPTLLDEVVDGAEAARERAAGVGGLVMSALGMALAAWSIGAAGFAVGGPAFIVATGALAYFGWVRYILRLKPQMVFLLRWVSPVVEGMVPFLCSLVMVASHGLAYVGASWVPPAIYQWVLIFQALRLRGWWTLASAAAASASWALVFWVLGPAIDPSPLPSTEVYSPAMQISRCLYLLGLGVVSAAVARGLRQGIRMVASRTRQRDLLGKYQMGPQLAVGGMGTVHRAVYAPEGGFRRPVAVKRIHPQLARDERFISGFRREAELGARLLHQNIVQVLDFGQIDDSYFLAMEFVDGADLGHLIGRARAEDEMPDEALVAFVGAELASALRFAHEEAVGLDGERLRIVHRDLTPSNVLISLRGEVKVTDFGIARAMGETHQHQTDHVMGKVAYLAPEQAQARPHDHRTDIFTLGVTLFELLTGVHPLRRASPMATAEAIARVDVPSWARLRPRARLDWARFFDRCFQLDPDRRFPSAVAAQETLLELLEEAGGATSADLRRWVERLLVDPPLRGCARCPAGLDGPR